MQFLSIMLNQQTAMADENKATKEDLILYKKLEKDVKVSGMRLNS